MAERISVESFKASFTIPWVHPSLNVFLRQHWAVRRQQAKSLCVRLAAAGMTPGSSPMLQGNRKMRVTVQSYTKRQRDSDNAIPKLWLDCIKSMGWIVDDGPEWCEQDNRAPLVDAVNPRTEITIESV